MQVVQRREPSKLEEALAAQYDARYYLHYSEGDPPYLPGEEHWERFFGYIAETLVAELDPKTVLDVGCGVGFLVGALRDRGVDAEGIDVSDFAIESVPESLKPYCRRSSVTDDLHKDFDLIVCIEVLEHLPDDVAQLAVANICRHATGGVVFSSTPTDFSDPTHQNVRPAHYWAEAFARWGLFRDPAVDCGFLSPQAVYFSKAHVTPPGLAARYEQWTDRLAEELRTLREDRRAHAEAKLRIAALEQEVSELRHSVERAKDDLSNAGAELARVAALADARAGLLAEQAARTELAEEQLAKLEATRTFRYTRPARAVYSRIRSSLARRAASG